MKFVCEKENLMLGLNAVSRTSVGRTTTPILEGILLTLKKKELIMMNIQNLLSHYQEKMK